MRRKHKMRKYCFSKKKLWRVFLVTVRKLNVMDRQTDRRGAFQNLPFRAFGAAGDNKGASKVYIKDFDYVT